MKNLTTQLIQGAKEFHLCKKPWNINQRVTTNTEKTIQRLEATTKYWELVQDNLRRRLKIIQQQREAFHMTAEIVEINKRLQNQRETTTNWECESRLEEKQPKLVKILDKAEQVIENHNMEMVEEFHVVDIQVIKVKEICDDFNCSDVYNSSPVKVKGFNGNQQAYRPQLMVIGHATNPSWNLGKPADIIASIFTRCKNHVRNSLSPQPWCIYDRGKPGPLLPKLWTFGQIMS